MTEPNGNIGVNNGIETVAVAESNENAFTMQMPRGWNNQAHLIRLPDFSHRMVVTAQSPDGETTLFLGDSHIPQFLEPTPDLFPGSFMAQFLPVNQRIMSYVPAEQFFLYDLQQRFQGAPGFRITGTAPNPTLELMMRASGQKFGVNFTVTATLISFDYMANGKWVHGIVNGTTVSLGSVWFADVSGVTTTGDPFRWNEFLFQMSRSQQVNPQWQQMEQNRHNQTMANMQAQNQNIQATTQANMRNHQMRMDAIHQAGEANTQRWQEQQAQNDISHQAFMNTIHTPTYNSGSMGNQSDTSHERFLNYIKDENTVVDQSGNSYQVDNSHERYYVNKHNNTYIGTDSTTELHDLRTKMGVNPDDYEEVRVKR